MQTTVIWEGQEYRSLEYCTFISRKKGPSSVHSIILGTYKGSFYKVEYGLQISPDWSTRAFEIKSRVNGIDKYLNFEGDGNGNWISRSGPDRNLKGCTDIDISLTPFTNTLPIRRLRLAPGDEKEIRVLYIDLLNEEIKPVRQKYTCIDESSFKYENVPNDFEALIQVDADGLVVDYPGLFERRAVHKQ